MPENLPEKFYPLNQAARLEELAKSLSNMPVKSEKNPVLRKSPEEEAIRKRLEKIEKNKISYFL